MSSPEAASAGFSGLASARVADPFTDDRQWLAWDGASDPTEVTQVAAEIAAAAQVVNRCIPRVFICVPPREPEHRCLDSRATISLTRS